MFYPYIEEGGLTWMLPMVFLSFLALAFCLERAWYWLTYAYHSRGRFAILSKLWNTNWPIPTAMAWCQNSRDVLIVAIHEFLVQYENVNLEIAERKARLVADSEVQHSKLFLDLLAVTANIAGTLGLMGTVVGISLIFKSLAKEDTKGIAMSLSTAVYTTIAGIILFLLAYLPLFFFQKFSDHLENTLDVNIQKLRDLLEVRAKSKLIFDQTGSLPSHQSGPERSDKVTVKVKEPPTENPITVTSGTQQGVAKHEERVQKKS